MAVVLGVLSLLMLGTAPATAHAAPQASAAPAQPRPILSADTIATQGVNPNALYYVRNWNSGKCLEVLSWSHGDGAPVGQWDCHYGYNQLWTFLRHDDGYYSLVNANSNKCLEIYNWSTADAGIAVQWTCHWGYNQRWNETFPSVGGLRYINKHSGRSLEIYGWSHLNGARAVQWGWHGGTNQRWY